MTDKTSARLTELERRLQYAIRIRNAYCYEGSADHEDVPSILYEFQREIIKEFTGIIIKELKDKENDIVEHYPEDYIFEVADMITLCKEAREIVKGAQNE